MKKLLLLVSLIVAGTSCSKNFIVYDNIESVVYLLNSGIVQLKLSSTSADVVVVKGGYTADSPSVSVSVDQTVLEEYNKANGTTYKMMPSSAYTFAGGRSVVKAETCTAHYGAEFNTDNLDTGLWMLPLRLTSDGVKVNQQKNTVMFIIEIK